MTPAIYGPAGRPRQLYLYSRTAAIFACPSLKYGEFRPGCPPTEATGDSEYPLDDLDGSYDWNYFERPSPFNEMRYRTPASTILYCDGHGDRQIFSALVSGSTVNGVAQDPRDLTGLGNRHGYGVNVCYADGHVKWRSYEALLDIEQWKVFR